MIDFPASPTPGQRFTAAGATWIWDGAKWLPEGLSPTVVPGINDNRIINGDMRIDQRNNGASGTANAFAVDRWQYVGSQVNKGTWQRIASSFPGFPYCLSFSSTSAFTPAAGDYFILNQPIEADMISDFQWGSASAQSVTLSFWVASSLTGTFSGAIRNYAGNRAYPFSYSIPTANTSTKVSITIPGDVGGAWVMNGNAGAAYVCFDLGAGSSVRSPANVWASGAFIGVTGSVNVVATNGAQFGLTGVKLEIGSVATPYNRQSLAKSMADCQRYYSTASAHLLATSTVGSYLCATAALPVSMRATPTLVIMAFSGISDTNINAPSVDGVTLNGFRFYSTAVAAGTAQGSRIMTASAEL